MLEAMSQLALDYLRKELPDDTGDKSRPWEWYLKVREERPDLLLPYLVESAKDSMAPNYYVLREDPADPETAILEQREFRREEDAAASFRPVHGLSVGRDRPHNKAHPQQG